MIEALILIVVLIVIPRMLYAAQRSRMKRLREKYTREV
jgi:hypothetical protein